MRLQYYTCFAAVCALFGFAIALPAQVRFHLQWLENEQAYQVSLVPEETWAPPQNITGSAQITLKAHAGAFNIFNVKCLVPDVVWELNSRQFAPAEAPGFDYLSFGLTSMGTSKIAYVAGQEVPLFTFQNANGCTTPGKGEISLVNNLTDPFMPPNSANANIGNQITVLGAGLNAFTGFVGEGKANCTASPQAAQVGLADNLKFEIFPPVTAAEVSLGFTWNLPEREVWLRLYDADGKLTWTANKPVKLGDNLLNLDASKLKAGVYSVELKTANFTAPVGRFVKE